MSFWGCVIKPKKEAAFVPPPEGDRLHISQACLAPGAQKGAHATLLLKVGDGPALAVTSLREGMNESAALDLVLDSYAEFSVWGAAEMHLTGYFIPGYEDDVDGSYGNMEDEENVLDLIDVNEMGFPDDEDDSEDDSDFEEDDDGTEFDSAEEEMDGLNELETYLQRQRSDVSIEDITDKNELESLQNEKALPAPEGIDAKNEFEDNDVSGSDEEEDDVTSESEERSSEGRIIPIEEYDEEQSDEEDEEESDEESSDESEETPDEESEKEREEDVPKIKKENSRKALKESKRGRVSNHEGIQKGKASDAKTNGAAAMKNATNGKRKADKVDTESREPKSKKLAKKGVGSGQKQEKESAAAIQQDIKEAPKGSERTMVSSKGRVRKWPNGFAIEEIKTGPPDGKLAKPGKKVAVRYTGKLINGKVFDATKGSRGFTFRLGVGEVVKGFDRGVEGMRIGDKRRVTIPPQMGYGSNRTGPIPPNSTLVFDLELVDVK